MNLILIYGPPAAGKLTVANKLHELIGYTVLDNHKATDFLPVVFPRSVPEFENLRMQLGRKIRLMVFEAAAEHDVNLIITFATVSEGRHDFIRDIHRAIERHGGTVCLVQLLPDRATLEHRVQAETRKGVKAETVARLHELINDHPAMFESFPDTKHLVIDNSELQPAEVARLIVAYYDLGGAV